MSPCSDRTPDPVPEDPVDLYEHAPCGLLTTAPDGTVLRVNATFEDLTGHRREHLVGRRTFADLLSPGGRIYHETHYAPMLQLHQRVREIALDLVGADGGRLPVLVTAEVRSGVAGTPARVHVAVFSAPDRRDYERELLAAKKHAEQSEVRARSLARTLQSTLIPPSPPLLPGLDVTAAYRPAGNGEEVGGDFYDVFQTSPEEWVVALGDVRGKGVEAAVVTALVRYTIRAVCMQVEQPSEVLRILNDELLDGEEDRFCTVVLLRLRQDDDGWAATMSAGGHPLPLLLDGHGRMRTVGAPGSLVGILEEVEYVDRALRLAAGDLLVLYPDGVTEGRRGTEFYGEERLAEAVLAHRAAPQPAEEVLGEVLAFQEGAARDDIAVVAVRVPAD
jgi:sigma-B regulation protein RsbU (phosphoserine phosphatase)